MILEETLLQQDKIGEDLCYELRDGSGKLIASARPTWKNPTQRLALQFDGRTYQIRGIPSSMEKAVYSHRFPLLHDRKKTLGLSIRLDGQEVARQYGEAMCTGKRSIFGKNIQFNVLTVGSEVYCCYRVGFVGEGFHYYCLLDSLGRTVAITQRHTHSGKNSRATVYLEEEQFLLPAVLSAALETMTIQRLEAGENADPSAGHYISLLEEEKAMFDPGFIPRVKALDGVTD